MQTAKPDRRPELDALRGLFLVWMTLTHLPTRFSDFVNDTLGYVSSAEGFVLISALLVGRIYMGQMMQDGPKVRTRLWKRSLKIYGYHLLMLALAFTVAATYAVEAHRAAIYNLLNFYIAHPGVAIIGSVVLLYCPPLLDVLPTYVIFLFFTPTVLWAAMRVGWKKVMAASGLVWLLAQFGLRDIVHNFVVHITHLPIPLQEMGAFNLFAWQAVWIAGLWIGATSAVDGLAFRRIPGWAIGVSAAVCVFFIFVRYGWLGPHMAQQSFGVLLDKWQIGPMRVLNLIAFLIVGYWLRRHVWKLVAREPLLTLGKASLQVFCVHVLFVFFGLALLYGDVGRLHGVTAVGLVIVTFASLILVAAYQIRSQGIGPRQGQARKPVGSSMASAGESRVVSVLATPVLETNAADQ